MRFRVLLLCAIAALFAAAPAAALVWLDDPDTTPPVLTVSAPLPVEATGTLTPVSFTATAVDDTDPNPVVNCDHASGSSFPVGTTTVTCTATDASNNTTYPPASFDVVVTDTTAPSLSVPGDFSVETENTSTTVTYSVTASDLVDSSPTVSCSPTSGSTFSVGTTPVSCTAQDSSGNTSPQGTFQVTVNHVDHTGPVVTAPASVTVEANGPSGSVANYGAATANDAQDGDVAATCGPPASGSTFPLGVTTVTCSATDAHGNTGTSSFTVSVLDRTKPSLTVPRDSTVYADTPLGIGEQGYGVSQFLSGASAVDTVDPHPRVSSDAPEFFTVGVHTVTFSATDASGNYTTKTAVLEVLPMPPAGTPPRPIPPPRVPPQNVSNLKADAGDGLVRLSWQLPAGVDHVEITRALTAGGGAQVVYTGSGEVFTDRGAVNGLEYRYLVVSFDNEGETSSGVAVVAVPKPTLLKTPKDGARLRKAPLLRWVPNSEASYYNVQLFRGSKKILSIWPVKSALQLPKQWRYQKHTYKLSRGVYRWYVWPGFGARKAVDYGEMLGFSTFQIIR